MGMSQNRGDLKKGGFPLSLQTSTKGTKSITTLAFLGGHLPSTSMTSIPVKGTISVVGSMATWAGG